VREPTTRPHPPDTHVVHGQPPRENKVSHLPLPPRRDRFDTDHAGSGATWTASSSATVSVMPAAHPAPSPATVSIHRLRHTGSTHGPHSYVRRHVHYLSDKVLPCLSSLGPPDRHHSPVGCGQVITRDAPAHLTSRTRRRPERLARCPIASEISDQSTSRTTAVRTVRVYTVSHMASGSTTGNRSPRPRSDGLLLATRRAHRRTATSAYFYRDGDPS